MTLVTEQFVIDALNSSEAFPIDFDDVWQFLGYSRKDNAVRKLRNDLDDDYYTILSIEAGYQSPSTDKYF